MEFYLSFIFCLEIQSEKRVFALYCFAAITKILKQFEILWQAYSKWRPLCRSMNERKTLALYAHVNYKALTVCTR